MSEEYYIIKTKDNEFVKVYAVLDYVSKPKEFCEYGFDGRRWKPEDVDIVEYPVWHKNTLHHRQTNKYLICKDCKFLFYDILGRSICTRPDGTGNYKASPYVGACDQFKSKED